MVTAAIHSSGSPGTGFAFERDLVWMDGSRRSSPPPRLNACDPGFYQDEQSRQCRLCPKGRMCLGGSAAPAVACPRGSFANDTGMTGCSQCAEGSFASDVGAAECLPCLPGYEAPLRGMEACSRCAPGSYMPFTGAAECFSCNKNQVTSESGATSQSNCLCPQGSFMCQGHGCLPCPEGLDCPEGLGPPLQQAGFWAASEAENGTESCKFSVFRCRDAYECPAGPVGTCASGREARACNNCKVNHFPSDGACQPCLQSDVLPSILVLLLSLTILYLLSISSMDPNRVRTQTARMHVLVKRLLCRSFCRHPETLRIS